MNQCGGDDGAWDANKHRDKLVAYATKPQDYQYQRGGHKSPKSNSPCFLRIHLFEVVLRQHIDQIGAK